MAVTPTKTTIACQITRRAFNRHIVPEEYLPPPYTRKPASFFDFPLTDSATFHTYLLVGMVDACTVSRVVRQGSEPPRGLARAHGQLELLAECDAVDLSWALEMADLLREARRETPPRVNFDPHDLAWIFQSIWQSARLLSRTRNSPGLVRRNIDEMHAYLDGLWSSVPFSPHQLHTSP